MAEANPVTAALDVRGVTASNKVAKLDNYERVKRDKAQAIGTYRAGIKALMEQKKRELTTLLDALTLTNRQLADLDADIGLKDITTREQFLINRANRINELKTAYEQHAQQFGAALNDKAIDILQQHSMINAPTLTSIMTGWEMARASQRDNDRVRLENMAKMYEQISQLEDRAMQIEMDAHKANLQHQRNEAEHAKGLLENELKVLEDIYGMTEKMHQSVFGAEVAGLGGGRGGSGDDGSSPFAGSLADMEAAVGGGQGTTQRGTNLSIPEIVRKLAGEKGSKWDHGSIPEGVIDDFTSKVIDYMRDKSFGYGTEREMKNLDEAANNPEIQRAAMRDVMNKWAESVKDSDMWRFKNIEEGDGIGKGTEKDKKGSKAQAESSKNNAAMYSLDKKFNFGRISEISDSDPVFSPTYEASDDPRKDFSYWKILNSPKVARYKNAIKQIRGNEYKIPYEDEKRIFDMSEEDFIKEMESLSEQLDKKVSYDQSQSENIGEFEAVPVAIA